MRKSKSRDLIFVNKNSKSVKVYFKTWTVNNFGEKTGGHERSVVIPANGSAERYVSLTNRWRMTRVVFSQ